MAWSNYQIFLAFLMVITGSINTLTTKWADRTSSEGKNGTVHSFNHPFFQASVMFCGEMCCLVVFKILYFVYSRRNDGSEDVQELTKGNRNFDPFILFVPAMCDMVGTSLMYIGLNLTYASSFQMLRGAVIVFVGLLSMFCLQRRLKFREWMGIAFVIVGLAIVGSADFFVHKTSLTVDDGKKGSDIIMGDILIICGQVMTALQMVFEEKYVTNREIPPLQAVGWEGVFGVFVLGVLQIPFYFIPAGNPFADNPSGVLEDAIDAFIQISHSWVITVALLGTIVSIAFFNFAGISVTKEISATTRMVLDSVRTIVIWAVCLGLRWQTFAWLQLLGFAALITGMCLYNNITCSCCNVLFNRCRHYRSINSEEGDDDVIENHRADLPDAAA